MSQGRYDDARKLWDASRQQVGEYVYWSNLGTLHALREDWPRARHAYEMASVRSWWPGRVSKGLEQTREKLALEEGAPQDFKERGHALLAQLGPAKVWFLCLLLLLPVVTGLKARWRWRGWVGLLLAAVFPLAFASWFQTRSASMVVLTAAPLHDGPSPIFRSDRAVPVGAKLVVFPEGDWARVTYPSEATGWVRRSDVSTAANLWGTWP